IPGNHDGAVIPGVTSLEVFVRNFCAERPIHTPEAGDVPRTAMTEPNVYWTLNCPFVTIVGLYTNVLEGPGSMGPGPNGEKQRSWLLSELREAPVNDFVILALHHTLPAPGA